MIKAILFDLDGTLLPMDYEGFMKLYFGALSKKVAPLGYEVESFVPNLWKGVKAMVVNDGTKPNEDAFWNTFADIYGDKVYDDIAIFDEFYRNEFCAAKGACGFTKAAKEVVDLAKKHAEKVVLATNPLFPSVATENRMSWAGLAPEDFDLFTTYENSSFSKPNTLYYKEICDKIGVKPSECLMIGNDVDEDMVAEKLGMKVFLLDDCLINKNDVDISIYNKGGFEELKKYIERINNYEVD